MEIICRVISWEGEWEGWGKHAGIKKYKLVGTKYTGDAKNSIENGVAKELTCMTHGHEQRRGHHQREWGCLVEGNKGEKIGQV